MRQFFKVEIILVQSVVRRIALVQTAGTKCEFLLCRECINMTERKTGYLTKRLEVILVIRQFQTVLYEKLLFSDYIAKYMKNHYAS